MTSLASAELVDPVAAVAATASGSTSSAESAVVLHPSSPSTRHWFQRQGEHWRASTRRITKLGVARLLIAGIAIFLMLTSLSIERALVAPGNDRVLARLAGWVRDHGGGALINNGERLQYKLHPPRVGGTPKETAVVTEPSPLANGLPERLAAVVGPVVPALPGEGDWSTIASSSDGQPALQVAFIRPDTVHTSYFAGIARFDPRWARFELRPGLQEPGHGPWRLSSQVNPNSDPGLLAVFNSAFRLSDSKGGYFADGRMVQGLRDGAASMVLMHDGTLNVGAWNRDMRMSPDIAAVRQNLALIVDNGSVVPGLENNVGDRWGATLGNKTFVARSGVGVTASGAVVYAVGQSLSAASLADVLMRAGAVRAMELDINPDWTSFNYYVPDAMSIPRAHKLLNDIQRPANRYESPSSRDFVAVYLKP